MTDDSQIYHDEIHWTDLLIFSTAQKTGTKLFIGCQSKYSLQKNFKNKSASQAVSNPEALGKGFDYNSAKSPHSSVFFLGHQKSK